MHNFGWLNPSNTYTHKERIFRALSRFVLYNCGYCLPIAYSTVMDWGQLTRHTIIEGHVTVDAYLKPKKMSGLYHILIVCKLNILDIFTTCTGMVPLHLDSQPVLVP